MRQNFKLFIAVFVLVALLYVVLIQEESSWLPRNTNVQSSRYRTSGYIVLNRVVPSNNTIERILQQHGNIVQEELFDYKFPAGTSLENFTLATGGQPLRNIVVATWRSGSTFLGDVLNSVPGNFYHYEPLLNFGITQIRGPPYAESAIKNLRNLLNCDFSDLGNYLDYGTEHTYLFTHNRRLWRQCDLYPQYCWDETFLNGICKQFPFQSMKTVRIRLSLMEDILKDKRLNVNIILLVRDPRAVLQSRKHRDWCPGVPDCDQPKLVCSDMVSDFHAAAKFLKLYPDNFRVYRYEDFASDPKEPLKELFKFFGLYFHPGVDEFLDTHTKIHAGGVSSTFRNSKTVPYHWKRELKFKEVKRIQDACVEAMQLWGYVDALNESHLHKFNPLTNYTIT